MIADSEGEERRERAFGGAGYDRFTDLAPAGDGYLFLGHSQLPGDMRRRLFAVRTDAAGRTLWERIIGGPDSLAALYVEPADGFVVAGGIVRDGRTDLLVINLDEEGRERWRRTIGTPAADDVNHGLAVLPNGNIVVVGYSRSWGARGNDILAVTLSPSGQILHQDMIGGADDDRPILAKSDGRGGVWVVGSNSQRRRRQLGRDRRPSRTGWAIRAGRHDLRQHRRRQRHRDPAAGRRIAARRGL